MPINIRRKDRSLSRKAQHSLYQNLSNLPMDLYFQLHDAILGIKHDEIDISSYTTAQLITAEYFINRHLFEPLLLGKLNFTPSEYSLKINSCLLKIKPKPAHAHLGNCVVTFNQYIHGLCLEDGSPDYETIYDYLTPLYFEENKINLDKRRAVAQMMLEFIAKGPEFYSSDLVAEDKVKWTYSAYAYDDTYDNTFSVTLSDNTEVELVINDIEFNQFIGICYHIFVREASRHMASPDYYEKSQPNYGKDLPFSIANFRSLKLVEAGEITFKSFLFKDSAYGVSTGENITVFGEQKLKKTKDKFEKVNNKFRQLFFKNNKTAAENFIKNSPENLPNDFDGDVSDQDCWSDDEVNGKPTKHGFA